jgi:hypothetical protein
MILGALAAATIGVAFGSLPWPILPSVAAAAVLRAERWPGCRAGGRCGPACRC